MTTKPSAIPTLQALENTSAKLLSGLYGGKNDCGLSAIATSLVGRKRNVKTINDSTGRTDGKITTLPSPEVMNQIAPGYGLAAGRGMLDHEELGHGCHTNFNIVPTNDLAGHVLNIIEDERVEQAAKIQFPGCAANLDALQAWNAPVTKIRQAKAENAGAVTLAVRILIGRVPQMLPTNKLSKGLRTAMGILADHPVKSRFTLCQSTGDSLALASDIMAWVKEGVEKSTPPPTPEAKPEKAPKAKPEKKKKSGKDEEGNDDTSADGDDYEGDESGDDGEENEDNEGQEGTDSPSQGQGQGDASTEDKEGTEGASGGQESASGSDSDDDGDGQESGNESGDDSSDESGGQGHGGQGHGGQGDDSQSSPAEAKPSKPSLNLAKGLDSGGKDAVDQMAEAIKEATRFTTNDQFREYTIQTVLASQLTPKALAESATRLARRDWYDHPVVQAMTKVVFDQQANLDKTPETCRRSGALDLLKAAIEEIRPTVGRLRGGLANALRRRGMTDPRNGMRQGDLDPVMLAMGGAGVTDRIFTVDDSEPGNAPLRISLVVDCSGSMQDKLKGAALALAALGEALSGLPNVSFSVVGFSARAWVGKTFNEKWGAPSLLQKQSTVIAAQTTTMAENGIARALVMLRKERKRGGREAIFVITDGDVDSAPATRAMVVEARKEGCEVFALGLENAACLQWMEADRCAIGMASNLQVVLMDLVAKLIMHADI